MKPETKRAECSRYYQRLATTEDYIGEDRVDEMVVTIKLVILAGSVEEFQDGEKGVSRRREECGWLDVNKSYTDPSAGGAKAIRDEGKYGLTCRYTSGENRMRDKRSG